jgi:hypothetical protein
LRIPTLPQVSISQTGGDYAGLAGYAADRRLKTMAAGDPLDIPSLWYIFSKELWVAS